MVLRQDDSLNTHTTCMHVYQQLFSTDSHFNRLQELPFTYSQPASNILYFTLTSISHASYHQLVWNCFSMHRWKVIYSEVYQTLSKVTVRDADTAVICIQCIFQVWKLFLATIRNSFKIVIQLTVCTCLLNSHTQTFTQITVTAKAKKNPNKQTKPIYQMKMWELKYYDPFYCGYLTLWK